MPMKLLLYSDLHISKTSSILPLDFLSSKFSYRQNMIIETGKYLAQIADEYKVDAIINLGDTFDAHTISSYDITTASEFFKCFRYLRKPHFVLVGNHEMINSDFNAIEILSNINDITVISKPSTISTNYIKSLYAQFTNDYVEEGKQLAFLPYCNYHDVLEFPKGDFLFSHQDIQGSSIRGSTVMTEGLDDAKLTSYYKLIFNGHIHKPSVRGSIITVGSITTHSFSDDDTSVPQCYVFDTDTLNLTVLRPTICPLFRKLDVADKDDLCKQLDGLDKSYKYIISCSCSYDMKEDIKSFLETYPDVLNFKLTIKVQDEQEATDDSLSIDVQSNIDIKKSFIEFLDTVDELKFPKDLYRNIVLSLEV